MFVDYRPSTYGDYEYPGWADAMGWLMAAFSLIFIPIGMIYKINRERDGADLLAVNTYTFTRSVSALKELRHS